MLNKDTIFHYCSIETFFAIIQNSSLRLSDLNKTNDFMEKRWITQFIDCVLKEELEKADIKIDLEEEYWYEDGIDSHLDYYNNEIKRVLYNNKPMLITCFSESRDILSQWRAYGQDGMGISIGFNYKKIKQLTDNKNHISIEKVIYNENKQKKVLAELIQEVILYMRHMFKNNSVKISNDFDIYFREEFDTFCEVLVDYIEHRSCVIKNPAFSEEREVRIIYDPRLMSPESYVGMFLKEIPDDFTKTIDIRKFKLSPIKFYLKDNHIVAFCDVDFTKMKKDEIINEIIIGPKSKLTENDIYYFMLGNGFDTSSIRISRSEATYR